MDEETKDSSLNLSKETLEKFAEVKTLVDDAEEAELIARQDVKDVRGEDEGLTEEGEVAGLEEEEKEEAEKKEEVKEEKESEAVEEEAEEERVEEKSTELTLPNSLIQAGYRSGLTDDDILALGDGAEAALTRVKDRVDKASALLGERGRQLQAEGESKVDKPPLLEFGTEDEDLLGKETLGKIETSHAGLDVRLANLEMADTKRRQEYVDSTVDGFFDGKAEEYPEFGKAKTLTDIELIKRQQIANKAFDIQAGAQFYGRSLPLNPALEQAFSIYESDNVKVKERTKLVSQVKSRSEQITIRPTKRKTEVKFSSKREKAMDSYRKELAKQGHAVPDDDED